MAAGTLPAWAGELAEVRERLARLETRAEAHEKASEERHRQVLAALETVDERLTEADKRWWKVALGLSALGMGGGAGAVELIRGLLGGP
jgi:hypothetical protein